MIKAFVFDAYGTLYDVQSVADVTDAAFPGYGELITQIWRLKQLEYSWLRSLMGRYEDFWTVTREALSYTLGVLGLVPDQTLFDKIAEAYNHLRPYPDAQDCLSKLSGARLAILSNGSPAMLSALVGNSGFGRYLGQTISVDLRRVFKPDPRAYELVEERLGVKPNEVMFVSSNGFDACGAKSFGFNVAHIQRVAPAALNEEIAIAAASMASPSPRTMFKALRMQQEAYGYAPDFIISSLNELIDVAATLQSPIV